MANTKAVCVGTGGWEGRDEDGVHFDRSTIRKIPDAYPPLRYDEQELAVLGLRCAGDVITEVPGLRYWELDRSRCMDHPHNKCGHQQRAFDFYWSILCGAQRGRITLGIGTGSCISPAQFGIDKYCGHCDNKELPEYMRENGYPHMQWDADSPLPFFDGKFGGVISNHSIEHLHNQEQAIREWLRVTESGGYVCIITPDMTFNQRGKIDPTHVHEFSANEFWEWLHSISDLPAFEVFAFNTLDNMFSFDVVLKRQ